MIVETEQQKKTNEKKKTTKNGYILFICDANSPIFVIYIVEAVAKKKKKNSYNRSNLINHGFLTIRNKGSMRARLERPTR